MCGIFIAFSKNGSRLSTQKCIKISKNLLNRDMEWKMINSERFLNIFLNNE